MRGIAILGIMLHNYCHFNGKIVQENEFNFLEKNNDALWQALTHPDTLLPVHLLSYFGHYGVPVFLFLSGLGLVMKYETSPKTSPETSARTTSPNPSEGGETSSSPLGRLGEVSPSMRLGGVCYHYLKLLRMLIVGLPLFMVVDALMPGSFSYQWDNVVAQLLMYINVLPQPDRIIWPGIYWFFGLMLELYILYHLLLFRPATTASRWRGSSWYVVILIVLCLGVQLFCHPEGEPLLRLHYNFVGSMLPFGAGILVGRYADSLRVSLTRWQWVVVAAVASALVFVMSFHFLTWLWIPLFVIIGCIAFVKVSPMPVNRLWLWLGALSAAMFVAHPIARRVFIVVAWKGYVYTGLLLYVLAAIALSWVVKVIIARIPKPAAPPKREGSSGPINRKSQIGKS